MKYSTLVAILIGASVAAYYGYNANKLAKKYTMDFGPELVKQAAVETVNDGANRIKGVLKLN